MKHTLAIDYLTHKYRVQNEKDWDAWQKAMHSQLFKNPYAKHMDYKKTQRQQRQ